MTILPRDAMLPHLGSALDAGAMQQVFDTALRRHDGTRVKRCRIEQVKYRPTRNCTVSWQLDVEGGRNGVSTMRRVAGRFCAAGDAAPRHARHGARSLPNAHDVAPPLLVPELELFAWFVPQDPELAGLGALCDAVRRPGAALGDAVAALGGAPHAPERVRAELIRYVPESRACARFDLDDAGGAGARRLYAKIDRDGGGGATDALMRALRNSPAQAEGRLVTPRPVLWQPSSGLHWQEGVDGEPLADLHPGECPPSVAARVGRLFAALHSTPAPVPHRIDTDELLRRQQDYTHLLAAVEPAWAPELERLQAELAAGADAMRALPQVTLHGDVHPRNVLADGERLALIDLDSACGGAAVLELGAWIASAIHRALLRGGDLAAVQEGATSLLRAYREASGQPAGSRLVAWALADALLCQRAYRSVANLHRASFARVPALLALARFIVRHGVEDRALPAQ